MKIEKIEPRSGTISILLSDVARAISLATLTKTIDRHIQIDAEQLKHLTGKTVDKTAGRNQLGPTIGK